MFWLETDAIFFSHPPPTPIPFHIYEYIYRFGVVVFLLGKWIKYFNHQLYVCIVFGGFLGDGGLWGNWNWGGGDVDGCFWV